MDILAKQEKDTSIFEREAERELARLNSEAANRDMEPSTTVDVFSSNAGGGFW